MIGNWEKKQIAKVLGKGSREVIQDIDHGNLTLVEALAMARECIGVALPSRLYVSKIVAEVGEEETRRSRNMQILKQAWKHSRQRSGANTEGS